MNINKREFVRHCSRYIAQPGVFILADRNNRLTKVTVTDYVQTAVATPVYDNVSRYGCGCEKKDGDNLCRKHQRA